MKKAAVFNDLSGFGKCSLTAAIPVLSAQGVQCCPMASAVLTNQTGYEYHKCTDLTDMIKDYIDNWQKNNAHFDGIYSGFMTGSKQIELFMDFLDVFYEENTMLLVDPVMGDDGNIIVCQKACLGQVWRDDIGLSGKRLHAIQKSGRVYAVGSAVISHHRVHEQHCVFLIKYIQKIHKKLNLL